jgi:hypothetical protein
LIAAAGFLNGTDAIGRETVERDFGMSSKDAPANREAQALQTCKRRARARERLLKTSLPSPGRSAPF